MMKANVLRRFGPLALLVALLWLIAVPAQAGEPTAANRKQAREIFNKVYNKVFGPQGCTLSYSVNIIGLYKTHGTIWMKGKKFRYLEDRYKSWCDGKTLWRADHKKRVVEIHYPNSPKRDKYASKFTFDLNDFLYSWRYVKEGVELSVDAQNSSKGIKHAKIILDRKTLNPTAVKVKVAFFWATVRISGFRSGGIDERFFIFPAKSYKGWKFDDKRDEE